MKYIRYIVFVLLPFHLLSCIRNAKNIDLPEVAPKISVSCFISPEDTLLMVNLSLSRPLNQYTDLQKLAQLKLSTVELSDGNTSTVLMYREKTGPGVYASNGNEVLDFINNSTAYPVVPGTSYILTVTTPWGETLSASTMVPLKNNSTEDYKLYPPANTNNQGFLDYGLDLFFQDAPGETNYYAVDVQAKLQSSCGFAYVNFDGPTTMLSDVENDGNILRMKNGHINTSCTLNTSDSLMLTLASVDVHYYKFHRSLENYSGDDPFQEPAPIYSNIQGGLGAFGSYRKYVKTVPVVF
jgi:hypothetical protein